jgi:hypothetical protein
MGRLADGPAFVPAGIQRIVERVKKTRTLYGNVVFFLRMFVPFGLTFIVDILAKSVRTNNRFSRIAPSGWA